MRSQIPAHVVAGVLLLVSASGPAVAQQTPNSAIPPASVLSDKTKIVISGVVPDQTRLSAEQAVQAAETFYKAVQTEKGETETVRRGLSLQERQRREQTRAEVSFIDPRADLGKPENSGLPNNWQKRWKVELPGEAIVEVTDEAGTVVFYRGVGVMERAGQSTDAARKANSVLKPALDKQKALALARRTLQFSGQPQKELVLKSAALSHRYAYAPPQYTVRFDRESKGAAYSEQGVWITVDAITGGLRSFGVNFPTPSVKELRQRVTQEHAKKVALLCVESLNLDGLAMAKSVKEQVVRPNKLWSVSEDGTRDISSDALAGRSSVSRRAWVFRFHRVEQKVVSGRLRDRGKFYEVWIDQETGKSIGGQIFGTR